MESQDIVIRKSNQQDLSAISTIYKYYVQQSIITFDLEPFDEQKFQREMRAIVQLFPSFVAESQNNVCGYAYASPWKSRKAYDQTVESSVYVKHGCEGNKIGSKLYTELLTELEKRSFRNVIAGISLPNDKSVRFHEKFGFIHSGTFKKVGYKFGNWIDVGYWQLAI